MDQLRQAAQQALEWFEWLYTGVPEEMDGQKSHDIRLALRAALAEQPAESLDGKLVMGLAVIRELTGTQKTDNIEATIEAVRKAVAPQPAKPVGQQDAQGDDFSQCKPPMRHIPGVRVDLLRKAAAPEAPQPAKPAEQEPVAVVKAEMMGMRAHIIGEVSVGDLLYKAAPQPTKREPLTDEQIDELVRQNFGYITAWQGPFVRAIEAAHGIGGQV